MAMLPPGPAGPRATTRPNLLIWINTKQDPEGKARLIATCNVLKIDSMSQYVRDCIDTAYKELPRKSRSQIEKLMKGTSEETEGGA